jgi:hypothetical protein
MYQRRYHILVADADETSLQRVVNLLKGRDYVVAGASTLDEARWWLSGWPIDLVVGAPRFGSTTGVQLNQIAREIQPEICGVVAGDEHDPTDVADARRHGLHIAQPSVDAEQFLTLVANGLASMTRRQRWPRKEIAAPIPMWIGSSTGKLMDVSYGGLKFELLQESYVLRSPVEIDFPRGDLRLQVDVVWSARRGHGRSSIFGTVVTAYPVLATEWRAFVDRIAQTNLRADR